MQSICKPPKSLSLEGNISENWRKFRQNFEIFLQASGSEKKESAVKVALLLNIVGEDGVDLYNTFGLDGHERRDLDKVLQAFEEYCSPKKNVVHESFKFWNRFQAEGEKFESFLTDLQELIETCEYGNVKDSLLRDRIVHGIRDKALQGRLLRIDNLRLQEAIEYCRAAEISKAQTKTLQEKVAEVNNVCKSDSKKFTKPKRGEAEQQSTQKFQCRRCATTHGPRQCPAFGKECKKCGIYNHLAVSCRLRRVKEVDGDENQEESGEEQTSDEDEDEEEFSNAVRKPTGLRSRPLIHPSNPQSTMSPRKKDPPTPNSSSRNTSQKSPALSFLAPPMSESELPTRNQVYPGLSDVTFDEDEEGEEYYSSNPESSDPRSRSDARSYFSELNESLNKSERVNESRRSRNTPKKPPRSSSTQNSDNCVKIIALVCLLLAVLYYFFMPENSGEVKESGQADENEAVVTLLRTKMTSLKSLFPSQDEGMWGEIASGIAGVKTKAHSPAVFLLLAVHNETTTCLAKKVAEVAKAALNGIGDVVLTPNMLENDIGKVFEVMEDRIKRSKAVVVLDLLSLQAEAMKAFHDICDQYNPLVDEAVYLYTMRSGGVEGESKNLMKLAEQELRKSFSKVIKEDTLTLLITSITNGAIFAIKAEERIPCAE